MTQPRSASPARAFPLRRPVPALLSALLVTGCDAATNPGILLGVCAIGLATLVIVHFAVAPAAPPPRRRRHARPRAHAPAVIDTAGSSYVDTSSPPDWSYASPVDVFDPSDDFSRHSPCEPHHDSSSDGYDGSCDSSSDAYDGSCDSSSDGGGTD